MKLLWKESTGELSCTEVSYCSYEVNVPYENDAGDIVEGSGFYFEDFTGSSWIVPNISQVQADDVTRDMFRIGSCDLTAKIGTWIPHHEENIEENEDEDDE